MLAPHVIGSLSVTLAACAFVLGARRTGWGLASLALWLWIVGPIVRQAFAQVPLGFQILVIAVLVLVAPFMAIRLLQRLVSLGYGNHASAHVAGTYLVRLLDGLWSAFRTLIVGPFRLLARLISRFC